VNNFSLRIISSFFLFLLISCLFFNDNFFFVVIIHFLLSLSIWEFLRLQNYRYSDKITSDRGNFFLSRQRLNSSDLVVVLWVNFFISSMIFDLFVISFFLFLTFIYICFFFKDKFSKLFGIVYVSYSLLCVNFIK